MCGTKVSIIVPMYNVELYIEKTIRSLLQQSHPNVEIILVDDKSTDRTLAKATAYAEKHSNIHLLPHPVNRGVSAARNTGLTYCTGDYITFVDPDDILSKQGVEVMLAKALQQDADLVLGVYKTFNRRRTSLPTMYRQFKSLSSEGQVFPFTNPEIFNYISCCGKLYRRELLSKVTFPEHISYTEDQPFSLYTYLNAKRIVIAASVVYFYRTREIESDSLTQQALIKSTSTLTDIFSSVEVGRKYVRDFFGNENNYVMKQFLNRIVQGSMRYTFEGVLKVNNAELRQNMIQQLIKWVAGLEDFLVYGATSLRNLFVLQGQEYIHYFDSETQRMYLELVRIIRNKMVQYTKLHELKTVETSGILMLILDVLDDFFGEEGEESKPAVCNPRVSYISGGLDYAQVDFDLLDREQLFCYQMSLRKIDDDWVIEDTQQLSQSANVGPVLYKKKPKIILTYREFSGCNTLALYKSVPDHIRQSCNVELVSGKEMTAEYVRKIEESDIVVTTNMEYPFGRYNYDPGKIVLDLWHGFPLKRMFYKDPGYKDKNAVFTYWSKTDYMASYSELYSDIVNQCLRVNPSRFVVTGAPRNDLLFRPDSRRSLLQLLEQEEIGQRFIIFLPTFRTSEQKGEGSMMVNMFGFDDFNIHQLDGFLEKHNFYMLVKSHPIYKRDFEEFAGMTSRVILFPSDKLDDDFMDLYEVLGGTDLLLTDYSSVYFDYLLLDKPIIFLQNDLESYSQERGFLLEPISDWTPGPKVMDQDGLELEILYYLETAEKYRNDRERVRKQVHTYQDNRSSERVWDFIMSLCKQPEAITDETVQMEG